MSGGFSRPLFLFGSLKFLTKSRMPHGAERGQLPPGTLNWGYKVSDSGYLGLI